MKSLWVEKYDSGTLNLRPNKLFSQKLIAVLAWPKSIFQVTILMGWTQFMLYKMMHFQWPIWVGYLQSNIFEKSRIGLSRCINSRSLSWNDLKKSWMLHWKQAVDLYGLDNHKKICKKLTFWDGFDSSLQAIDFKGFAVRVCFDYFISVLLSIRLFLIRHRVKF